MMIDTVELTVNANLSVLKISIFHSTCVTCLCASVTTLEHLWTLILATQQCLQLQPGAHQVLTALDKNVGQGAMTSYLED